MKRIHKHISLLAALTLLCTACITGAWDECPDPEDYNTLTIHLNFQEPLTYASTADWQNATLFVLQQDKDSLLATRRIEPLAENLVSIKELGLKLDSTYRFLVLFNLDVEGSALPYKVDADTFPPAFYMDIASLEGDSIKDSATQILPMFRGFAEQELISTAPNVIEIPVVQQTNDITITIVGENVMPLGDADEVYEFVITDSSARYALFDNRILAHPKFRYVSTATNDPVRKDSIETKMRLLKLSADAQKIPDLTVMTPGRKVFAMPDNTSLMLLIKGAYEDTYHGSTFNQDVLDKYHNFNIKINLDDAHGMTITINDWDVFDPGYTLEL